MTKKKAVVKKTKVKVKVEDVAVVEEETLGWPYNTTPSDPSVVEMVQKAYADIRDGMQTGDIIAFSGNGLFSKAIAAVTGVCRSGHEVSHVAMVLRTTAHSEGVVQLIESTSLGHGDAGVKINRMSDHMKYYEGKMWWYPLKRDRQLRIKPMLKWLLAQEGKPYDLPQALLSALDFVPQKEDFAALFCSELCAEALEKGGFIEEVIASRITPVELIDDYFHLYEKSCLIV